MNGCVAKLHLALDGLPESWVGVAGRIVLAPASDHVERAFDAAKYGRVSREAGPGGRHSRPWPIRRWRRPASMSPRSWRNTRPIACARRRTPKRAARSWSAASICWRKARPDLRRRVIATEVLTPQDLEAQFGLTGGQWHHGEVTLDQMFFLRPAPRYQQYRMPVPGLWLCGAGAHPGGNVSGAAGRQCGARDPEARARRARRGVPHDPCPASEALPAQDAVPCAHRAADAWQGLDPLDGLPVAGLLRFRAVGIFRHPQRRLGL